MNTVLSNLSDTDKAYLAGLFDGEGCINACINTKKYFPKTRRKFCFHAWVKLQFVISNKDHLLLEKGVKTIVGFGGIYREGDIYDWRVTKREQLLSVFNALIPHVKLKKKALQVAKDAVLFLLQRRYRQRWTKDELIFLHEKFVLPLQKLLPSGEKRGRPPKYTFQEILSNLC